jgi:hypothetical protein
MDTRDGTIGRLADMQERVPGEFLQAIKPSNLPEDKRRELELTGRTKVGMRMRCPCGSGKRFKSCCWAGRTKRKRGWKQHES